MSYRSSRDDRYSSSSSRRESSPSRSSSHRSRDSRRSPGPSSRGRSPAEVRPPRADDELPESFGRTEEEREKQLEDDGTVLFKMKAGYKGSPLAALCKCMDGSKKVKVWTRNYKEVRGIAVGYVVAFDKHWNLIMSDVEEVYLKPKRAKTPWLEELSKCEDYEELKPKEPRKKKAKSAEGEPAVVAQPAPAKEGKKKKKPRSERKANKSCRRHLQQMFVRGDNIVMIVILSDK